MTTIEPRTSVVTIFQGDYLDRIRHVEAKHEAAVKAEKTGPPLLGGEIAGSIVLAEEHSALVAEAEESALHIGVRALPRKVWRELVKNHPARPDNAADEIVGVNEDTFKDALVMFDEVVAGVRYRTLVDEDLTVSDIDALSDADFDRVYFAAFAMNRNGAGPKVLPASRTNRASDGS